MEERLAGGRVAGFDHVADVGLEGAQVFVSEWLGRLTVVGRELLAPGFEAGEAGGELLDALAAGALGHRGGLEGAEVALDCGVCLADLCFDPLELCYAPRALLVELGERLLDRLAHDRLLFEGLEEAIEDRLVEPIGGETVGVAAALAVALAGEADVVGVAAAVAVGGGADVALAAAGAADQAGEQVVGLVGASERGILAAFLEYLLRTLEERFVDQRLMRRRIPLSAEGGFAEVASVAQDRQHGVLVKGAPLLGLIAALGEPAGERGGALEPLGVAAEDLPHDRRLGRVGHELAVRLVAAVAEGELADPLAARRLSFHPRDHALDDRGALELGEHPEPLDHHPAGG